MISFPRGYGKRGGGTWFYISDDLEYKLKPKLSKNDVDAEISFVEIINDGSKNIVIGNVYRPPCGKIKSFRSDFENISKKLKYEGKTVYIAGDFNLNLLNHDKDPKVRNFVNKMNKYLVLPAINKPTRVYKNKATCIDNIYYNVSFDLVLP